MKNNVKHHLFGIILISFSLLPIISSAQSLGTEKLYGKYYKWGIVAGPLLYDRANLSNQYGSLSIENKPTVGYHVGLEYDFFPTKSLDFTTALIVATEPGFSYKFKIDSKDLLYSNDDLEVKEYNSMSFTTLSMPFMIKTSIKLSNKTFLSLLAGIKVSLRLADGWLAASVDDNPLNATGTAKKVFKIEANSAPNQFFGSFIIGPEITHAFQKFLLKTKFIYVANYHDLLKGEYVFDNLLTSPQSGGTYNLSGNYIGILFTVNLKKFGQ